MGSSRDDTTFIFESHYIRSILTQEGTDSIMLVNWIESFQKLINHRAIQCIIRPEENCMRVNAGRIHRSLINKSWRIHSKARAINFRFNRRTAPPLFIAKTDEQKAFIFSFINERYENNRELCLIAAAAFVSLSFCCGCGSEKN